MRLTATKLMAIDLTTEEKNALILTHDIIANFNNKAVNSFDEDIYQSPIYGDVIELDEFPRVLGVIDFLLNNSIVHAIDKE